MKKALVIFLAFVTAFSVFGQTATGNIADYYPLSTGNIWAYVNALGKTTEIITIKQSAPDEKDGTVLYAFEHQMAGGATGSLKSIKNNNVVILATINVLGRTQLNEQPYPVELAPAGQEWRYNDRGDDLRYKTSRASCSFDDKTYSDCIMVEERIVDGNRTLRTKKSYYAKDIGLVYVTLQGQGERETVYMKLESYNFADIKNASGNSELTQLKEDLVLTQMFFFAKLAEEGIENIESQRAKLHNNVQKSIFDVFCTLVKGNLSSLSEMLQLGTLRIGTYLNTPVPEFLIMIYLDNKYIATAIDKAIKIIVLSIVLNKSKDRLKNSISDQKYLEGTKNAEPLLSNLYKIDSSISNDDNKNIVEPIYRECIDLYLRHGGK
jgi:hypothetical protein